MGPQRQKKILVIGASGLLGKALVDKLQPDFLVLAPLHKELDIIKEDQAKAFIAERKPDAIILSAAYTNVDGCEEDPALAREVNVQGPKNVAEAAELAEAVLVYISTDYVFDGKKKSPYTEDDLPKPLSVYARSKYEAEKIVSSISSKSIIIRTSWLFGDTDKGFVASILKSIQAKEDRKVINDKYASPTYVVDLAAAIKNIIRLCMEQKYDYSRKILHITNGGVCSWFDIAEFMAQKLKSSVRIDETRLHNFAFRAERPRYTALDNSRYIAITGQPLRPWQEALGEFLECQQN